MRLSSCDGFFHVLGLRFALLCDVAASMVLTVAAAAIYSELDVAESFWLAVAAAALSGGELPRWGAYLWRHTRRLRCSTTGALRAP